MKNEKMTFDDIYHAMNKVLFKHRRNPLFAWDSIQYSINEGQVFPDWVFDYLLKTGESLLKVEQVNGDLPKILPQCFGGLHGPKFKQYHRDKLVYFIVTLVEKELSRKISQTAAYEKVSQMKGVTVGVGTIKDFYEAYKKNIQSEESKKIMKEINKTI